MYDRCINVNADLFDSPCGNCFFVVSLCNFIAAKKQYKAEPNEKNEQKKNTSSIWKTSITNSCFMAFLKKKHYKWQLKAWGLPKSFATCLRLCIIEFLPTCTKHFCALVFAHVLQHLRDACFGHGDFSILNRSQYSFLC